MTTLLPTETASFQDIMAEQWRRAPWLVLSAVAHAALLLLLFVLTPPAHTAKESIAAEIRLDDAPPLAQPEPPRPPEPVVEPTVDTPLFTDEVVEPAESESILDALPSFDVDSRQSAFLDSGDNPTIGIGGGAGGGNGPYGLRSRGSHDPSCRAQAESIERALEWLAAHQDEDGKWDCDDFMKHDDRQKGEPCDGRGNGVHDTGVTGLAMLAFLGDGSTLGAGPYRENIARAVRWLRENQQENGLFGGNASSDFIYDHAIAAYAICEAAGLSESSVLKRTAQRGLDYLEQHRNPYGVWRYQPRDGDGDTSVAGWCIMAYESGKHFGLQVNDAALKIAATWLEQATDANGRTGYCRAGEPSSRHPGDHMTKFPPERGEAMTAVALFCRFFLGQDPKDTPVMRRAADLIAQRPPAWQPGGGAIDFYYWYYGSYALYQMGGNHWRDWSKKLLAATVATQRNDGNSRGSWDPVDVWGEDGGRVYSTAMQALSLEAYYRYSRLVR